MSRSANPGPVHLSGVGDVCRPFWEDLGQEPSRPLQYSRHVLTGGGDCALQSRWPLCLETGLCAVSWATRAFPVLPPCSGLTGKHTAPSPAPRAPGRRPGGGADMEPCPAVVLPGGSCPAWLQTCPVGAALLEYWFFSKLGISHRR